MGSPPVPSYANIFMATNIDQEIQNLAQKYNLGDMKSLQLIKRFLDDIFLIFNGSTKKLHELFNAINKINPTIKFTMNHTSLQSEPQENRCSCKYQESIPFLDPLCSIVNGRIETDLYKKETDRNQYLLTSSIHPVQCTRNLPYSLALRIVRICSRISDRDKRFLELKNLLLDREYPIRVIDNALEKAKKIPRSFALQKVNNRKQTDRSIFAVTFDPRLPSIPNLQAKHWRSMIAQDCHLAEVFPKPPLTAFKRQRNLRDILIRAKVPKPVKIHKERQLKGMKKCGKSCVACPYILEGNVVKIGLKEWKINTKLNCNSYNVIYLLKCKKENCKERYYIGQTKNMFKNRVSDHKGYITKKKTEKSTGYHFSQPGYSLSDLTVTLLELVKKNDPLYRREREKHFINKFNTLHKGMNREL